jgi:hypothetical protein
MKLIFLEHDYTLHLADRSRLSFLLGMAILPGANTNTVSDQGLHPTRNAFIPSRIVSSQDRAISSCLALPNSSIFGLEENEKNGKDASICQSKWTTEVHKYHHIFSRNKQELRPWISIYKMFPVPKPFPNFNERAVH